LEGKARVPAFCQGLQQLGWIDGRNVQIDVRWAEGDVERIAKDAADLAALAPDVTVATGNSTIGPHPRRANRVRHSRRPSRRRFRQ
jgi:putative ABC transport system substrate-binding protein